MAAPREKIIMDIDNAEAKRLGGLAAYNEARRVAGVLKAIAVRECPVDNSPSRPADRGTHMRDEHKAVYLGNNVFAVLVDKDYALFVHDGTRRNRANRWLTRSLDAVVMMEGLSEGGI